MIWQLINLALQQNPWVHNITTETLGHGERQKKTLGQDVHDKQDKKSLFTAEFRREAQRNTRQAALNLECGGKTPLFVQDLWISTDIALNAIE